MTAGETMRVALEPLTAEAFAPFGDIIGADEAASFEINDGTSRRFDDLAAIDVARDGGRVCVSIFQAAPRPLPLLIEVLERHPLGSQAFVPLEAAGWLVVVAEGGAVPEPATLRAFRARGRQGVNYRPGAWHHPLLVLEPQDFLVIDRAGPGENLEVAPLAKPAVLGEV